MEPAESKAASSRRSKVPSARKFPSFHHLAPVGNYPTSVPRLFRNHYSRTHCIPEGVSLTYCCGARILKQQERVCPCDGNNASRNPFKRVAVQILIADDDAGFRTFVRRVLDKESDTSVVGEALDGHEAVRKAENLKPNLILMDMDLPRMDGLEATRRVKASLPGTVIVMLGSLDGPAYREAAARSGADGFMPKTTPIAQILSTIRHWSPPKSTTRGKDKSQ